MTRSGTYLPNQGLGVADLARHNVLIVGTGREGSALAGVVQKQGSPWVAALDGEEGQSASAWREKYGDSLPLWVVDQASGQLPTELQKATLAVMSPGVPVTSALHQMVSALDIPVTSGSALFVHDHAQHMVAVTGSKGKSTTTSLTHHLLSSASFESGLGGNMGIPLLGLEDSPHYTVELSSYQCHYLTSSPRVTVLTALFPEHLDWHGSESEYYRSKLNLVGNTPEVVIANGDDPILRRELSTRFPHLDIVWVGQGAEWSISAGAKGSSLVHADTVLFEASDLPLLGAHNHLNALMAVAAAHYASGIDAAVLAQGLGSFRPLPHRLEPLQDPSGVVFVNDSLATNPQAAAAALRALGNRVILLIGGKDRGVDYQPLMDQIAATEPLAVLGLPNSGPRLIELAREAMERHGSHSATVLEAMGSMDDAVRRARELAAPGDYVVLSPAAPSFGLYRDYAERAEDFMRCIEATRKGA